MAAADPILVPAFSLWLVGFMRWLFEITLPLIALQKKGNADSGAEELWSNIQFRFFKRNRLTNMSSGVVILAVFLVVIGNYPQVAITCLWIMFVAAGSQNVLSTFVIYKEVLCDTEKSIINNTLPWSVIGFLLIPLSFLSILAMFYFVFITALTVFS